jgi:hypothetical protein
MRWNIVLAALACGMLLILVGGSVTGNWSRVDNKAEELAPLTGIHEGALRERLYRPIGEGYRRQSAILGIPLTLLALLLVGRLAVDVVARRRDRKSAAGSVSARRMDLALNAVMALGLIGVLWLLVEGFILVSVPLALLTLCLALVDINGRPRDTAPAKCSTAGRLSVVWNVLLVLASIGALWLFLAGGLREHALQDALFQADAIAKELAPVTGAEEGVLKGRLEKSLYDSTSRHAVVHLVPLVLLCLLLTARLIVEAVSRWRQREMVTAMLVGRDTPASEPSSAP